MGNSDTILVLQAALAVASAPRLSAIIAHWIRPADANAIQIDRATNWLLIRASWIMTAARVVISPTPAHCQLIIRPWSWRNGLPKFVTRARARSRSVDRFPHSETLISDGLPCARQITSCRRQRNDSSAPPSDDEFPVAIEQRRSPGSDGNTFHGGVIDRQWTDKSNNNTNKIKPFHSYHQNR